MQATASAPKIRVTRHCLAVCLAVALGTTLASASDTLPTRSGDETFTAERVHSLSPVVESRPMHGAAALAPAHRSSPSIHAVTTCDDDPNNPDSLRAQVANAASGDTIDLSPLLMVCSTITLGSEIVVAQDSLRIVGPGADHLTIDGDSHSRIFKQTGDVQLGLYDLSLMNGYYSTNSTRGGGCISSYGTVILVRSVVSHCELYGTSSSYARGGGIFADGLVLDQSEISNSQVHSVNGKAVGGAAYVVGDLHMKYSTISNDTALSALFPSQGGGVSAQGGDVTIEYSTISGNRSSDSAALYIAAGPYSASITNSTISSNVAEAGVGGITTRAPLTILHSTITFNMTRDSSSGAGLYAGTPVALYNSMVAGNGGPLGESDILGDATFIYGTGNLVVISTATLPSGTIQACPKLEPLANNGGLTLTHALKHDSPAIDQAGAPNLTTDQRLAPRIAGPEADIGSVEWQPGETDERLFVGGFDGLCDQ